MDARNTYAIEIREVLQMKQNDFLRLKGFYENELCNSILSFWLPRCFDEKYGGYLNCFDNTGTELKSYDKYTWSQGRFLWLFSRMAATKLTLFSNEQRRIFMQLAENGMRFLKDHVLMPGQGCRCVFLMERDGSPKKVPGWNVLDMSIYADCFVVLGMAAYSVAAKDEDAYFFAKELYFSILERVDSGSFQTLPYPLSNSYRAHGIPMILINISTELHRAALIMDPGICPAIEKSLTQFADDIMEHFVDETNVIHEVISADKNWVDGLLGQHANPGHTLECMWFLMEAATLLNRDDWTEKIAEIAKRALQIGWDTEHGGIFHYCHVQGGPPKGELLEEREATEQQVLDGWGDKLWWVHSEALYTTLLCWSRTKDVDFWDWHEKVFSYTFRVFPNPDTSIGEWIQIRGRDGVPQQKVVALPVKDPFHIARNLLLILELLDDERKTRIDSLG